MAHDIYATSPHLLVGHNADVSIRQDIGSLLTERTYALLDLTAADLRALRGARFNQAVKGFLLTRFHLSTRYEGRLEQRKWVKCAHSGQLPGSPSESKKSRATWSEIASVVYVNEGQTGISQQAAHKRFAKS